MDETQMQPVAPGGIGDMGSPEQAAFFQATQGADPRQIAQDTLSAAREIDPRTTDQFIEQIRSLGLAPEVIEALLMMVNELLKDPQNYAQNREALIAEGVPQELLPEQFDPQYLGAMKLALEEIKQPVVQGFATGGIVELRPIAKAMAAMGRNGDTMLAHITPFEASVLKSMGGSATINPHTGLPEFFLKSIAKAVGNVVKGVSKAVSSVGKAVTNFVKSDVGRIVTTVALTAFLGPGAFGISGLGLNATLAAGLAGAGTTLLGGGNLKDALKAGLISAGTAYGLQELGFTGADKPSQFAGGDAEAQIGGFYGDSVAPITDASPAVPATGPSIAPAAPSAPDVGQMATQNVATPGTVSATPVAPSAPVAPGGIGSFGGDVESQLGGFYGTTDSAFYSPQNQLTLLDGRGYVYDSNPSYLSKVGPQPTDLSAFRTKPGFLDQLTSGDITGAAKTGYQNIKDFYMGTGPTIDARNAEATRQFGTNYMSLSEANQGIVDKALAPTFGTGTKLAATGIGAAYIGGAFKPQEQPQPNLVKGPTGEELLAQDPSRYMPSIFAGQTPVSYATVNPAYYQQRSYGTYNPFAYRPMFSGGIRAAAKGGYQEKGGIESLSKFPRKTGQIDGPGTETSDSIPAKLSDGEFVMTARAVRGMGNGSRRLGAKRMYQLMAALEKRAKGKA